MSRSGFAGLPPWQVGTGAVFCFTTGGFGRRFGRPVGGSAAFVAALVRRLTTDGGAIHCGFETAEIERRDGRWNIRSTDGRSIVATRAAVSAIPPQETLLRLVRPDSLVPPKIRDRLRAVEVLVDNVSQLTLTAVLASLPPTPVSDEYFASTLWLVTDPEAVVPAYEAARHGRLPDQVGTLLTFPSLMDSTLTRNGVAATHTMWANSFVGATLDGGWEPHRTACTDLVWRTIEACVPGTRDRVTFERLTTPADLEQRTGSANPGNHVAPVPAQMLRNRPVRGLGWRTPITGLYLTGAGTHPAGGVSGDAGHRTAQVVIADLRHSRVTRTASAGRMLVGQLAAGVTAWKQVRATADASGTINR